MQTAGGYGILLSLHLDDAQPAGAVFREILMMTQMRDVDSGIERTFEDIFPVRHRKADSFNRNLSHIFYTPSE